MPSLNFQSQFVPGILAMLDKNYAKRAGIRPKTTTIRAQRKVNIKRFDELYLFSGQRTKKCVRLGTAICKKIEGIFINETKEGYILKIDGFRLSHEEALAIAEMDGFNSLKDMIRWFKMAHGFPFLGVRIHFASTYCRKYFCNLSVKKRGFKLHLETTQKTILITPDQYAAAKEDRYVLELAEKHNYGVQIEIPFR